MAASGGRGGRGTIEHASDHPKVENDKAGYQEGIFKMTGFHLANIP
jgi:hypothetical protein